MGIKFLFGHQEKEEKKAFFILPVENIPGVYANFDAHSRALSSELRVGAPSKVVHKCSAKLNFY